MNWNELWKIRLNNYSDEFLAHEVVKLILMKSILQKYHKSKKYQEIYTEYPVGEGRVCDVFWRNNLSKNKDVIFFEIQKKCSPIWLETTKKAYSELNGDLIIIPLEKLSDSLSKLNLEVKEFVP